MSIDNWTTIITLEISAKIERSERERTHLTKVRIRNDLGFERNWIPKANIPITGHQQR